jgi:hypothetical protein
LCPVKVPDRIRIIFGSKGDDEENYRVRSSLMFIPH